MAISAVGVMDKVNAYAKTPVGKKRMDDTIRNYVRDGNSRVTARGRTEGGSNIVTQQEMRDIAEHLIEHIRHAAASHDLPESVMAHVESFEVESAGEWSPEIYHVGIGMSDNPRRESVQPENYEGVFNIVALFNSGYSARACIYGYWPSADKEIWTLQQREGMHFIQEAVAKFNRAYDGICDVTVVLSSEYE